VIFLKKKTRKELNTIQKYINTWAVSGYESVKQHMPTITVHWLKEYSDHQKIGFFSTFKSLRFSSTAFSCQEYGHQ